MNKQIAITIPSFLRFDKLKKEVQSIIKSHPANSFRLYIGDQGKKDSRKEEFYTFVRKYKHEIYRMPFNCGAIYTRNYLIKKTKEPYILVIDNDFTFNNQSNLKPFLEVLEENKNIGIVGGVVNSRAECDVNYIYDLVKDGDKLYFIYNSYKQYFKTIKNHYRYIPSNLVLNFFLARREVFNDILWDENYKMYGHIDFFLRMKEIKWSVAYTPDVEVYHQKQLDADTYLNYRLGNRENSNTYKGIQYFYKKWNLKPENIIKDQNNPFIIKYKEIHAKSK